MWIIWCTIRCEISSHRLKISLPGFMMWDCVLKCGEYHGVRHSMVKVKNHHQIEKICKPFHHPGDFLMSIFRIISSNSLEKEDEKLWVKIVSKSWKSGPKIENGVEFYFKSLTTSGLFFAPNLTFYHTRLINRSKTAEASLMFR